MPLNKKVFISSTYSDLKLYRQHAINAIKKIGLEPILLDEIPSGANITDEINKTIKNSDIVVMIISHRYGQKMESKGKSYVEYEFDKALKMGKPMLVYLAREDIPIAPDEIDVDRSEILNFRNKIINSSLFRKYSSPNELETKISEDLIKLINYYTEIKKDHIDEIQNINNSKIVKLLLSSPADVSDERERVPFVIFRYNQLYFESKKIFIKLIRWEDMAPQIGPGPQNVINEQIGNYHIFVGLMWNRFGTPTDIAASGTKEEFDTALQLWQNKMKPWVTFYFCDRPSNFTNSQQLDQKANVINFRDTVNGLGISRSYLTTNEFENMLFEDLVKIIDLMIAKELI